MYPQVQVYLLSVDKSHGFQADDGTWSDLTDSMIIRCMYNLQKLQAESIAPEVDASKHLKYLPSNSISNRANEKLGLLLLITSVSTQL